MQLLKTKSPAKQNDTNLDEGLIDRNGVAVPAYLAEYLPDEEAHRVLAAKHIPQSIPTRKPSAIRELYRLTNSSHRDNVGESGSAMAAVALDPKNQQPESNLYKALFGRDSLRVAQDTLERYPRLTRTTLLDLARHQGVRTDISREEQIGKIIHEYRDLDSDPIAQLITKEQNWGWPYFGAVDSTIQYVRTIYSYCKQTDEGSDFLDQEFEDRNGRVRTMADSLLAAVGWIEGKLDDNPEGVIEFKRMNPTGLSNQVWKDSWDSYHHADGKIANHEQGIASVEVQVLAYDALIEAAELYEQELGYAEDAKRLHHRVEKLKQTIHDEFWTGSDDDGYFVLGTDRDEQGNLQQLKIKTSNMGHVLNSRLLEGDDERDVKRREAVIKHLFSDELLNVSGIRTLAKGEARFNPGAYHNGSVWLWDTYYIAQGLSRHGYRLLSSDLESRILNVVNKTGMFPEFVRGDDGDEPTLNAWTIDVYDKQYGIKHRLEQPPQEVQAWSVAAALRIKSSNVLSKLEASDPKTVEFEKLLLSRSD